MSTTSAHIVAVNIGNTRTSFGVFDGEELTSAHSASNADSAELQRLILESVKELAGAERAAVIVADVNPEFAGELIAAIQPSIECEFLRVGQDLPAPIHQATKPGARTGQDRLLAACAAFEQLGQACAVVDAGTAITVDFIDGEGVFQGGAIAPGPRMMLKSLDEGAAQLPDVQFHAPSTEEPWGKNTEEAMLIGVCQSARGAVRQIVETYAERYGAYPRVIATGGDAHTLFDGDEFIETIVDDLVLRGIAIAYRKAIAGEDEPILRASDAGAG